MDEASSSSLLGPQSFNLAQSLFKPLEKIGPPAPTTRNAKVTIIGAGNVGMAIAQTILTQDLADELVLVDANAGKLRGDVLGLQHAASFLPRTSIVAATDYEATAGSVLCIVTAGASGAPGESRLNPMQRNLALFGDIVPPLAKLSPEAVLVVVSNPVDVLTHVAWKLSGFPSNRVIGSGTNLDSSRFRFLIAEHLDVNAQDVQAYIVGEHGDSSVAPLFSISVGGVPVLSFLERRQIAYITYERARETLDKIHKEVVQNMNEVISLKGDISLGIGYSVGSLARTILRDERRIHPVSVLAEGFYGIANGDVFLSLPAQLGRSGVLGVMDVHPTEEEERRLRASAEKLMDVQRQFVISYAREMASSSDFLEMGESSFKQEHDLEERCAMAAKRLAIYPNRVPVIVEKAERSDIPGIDKKRCLARADWTVEEFKCMIRKKIKLSEEKAVFIFVDNELPPTGAKMSAIYDAKKNEDGFLYVTYGGKNTFGDN